MSGFFERIITLRGVWQKACARRDGIRSLRMEESLYALCCSSYLVMQRPYYCLWEWSKKGVRIIRCVRYAVSIHFALRYTLRKKRPFGAHPRVAIKQTSRLPPPVAKNAHQHHNAPQSHHSNGMPSYSAYPSARFIFCKHCVAAPLSRLSIVTLTTARMPLLCTAKLPICT